MVEKVKETKVIPEETVDTKVPVASQEVPKITWNQLVLKYSTKKERFQLCLGLVCSFVTGFLIPISYIFLGDIVNESNLSEMSMGKIGQILLFFVSNLLITSIFAFFERKCLNGYAGFQ